MGDEFGGVGGAVGGGDDGDVVAGAGAAVFARVAEEGGDIGGAGRVGDLGGGELVVEGLLFKQHVVGVDVLAGFDRNLRAADDLAVAEDPIAGRDGLEADFVAGGD